jgi:hypothetical protein
MDNATMDLPFHFGYDEEVEALLLMLVLAPYTLLLGCFWSTNTVHDDMN